MSTFGTQILGLLDSPEYHPSKTSQLAKQLGVTKSQVAEFKEALEVLIADGLVRKQENGILRRKAAKGLITGIVRRAAAGFGFLTPTDAPNDRSRDIYISKEDLKDAQSGDEVMIQLMPSDRRDGKPRGRVMEVLQRETHTFVGTYFEQAGGGFVRVDGTVFTDPISVGDPGAKGAKPQDKVVIEMLRFPSHSQVGEAVLTQVLGQRGQPGVDTLSIIHEFGLPDEFPEEVLAEARLQASLFDETNLEGRLDLTGETIITIDPVDARDFDDAISLQRCSDGHWHLGVHIADVSHFVPVGSALDREAQQRSTSCYLPDRVIPMLPEILSNGLASLQQGHVRFTKTAFIEFSADGIPIHTKFANSAIRVVQRFAYEQVMPIIEKPELHRDEVSPAVNDLLQRMYEFAMLLRKRRFKRGALELSLPEVKIDFDDDGKVSGAHTAPHDASHEIIEEFMLAANIAVATALNDQKFPFMRRAHGDPDELKLRKFADFASTLGLTLTSFQSRHAIQALLDEVEGKPIEQSVSYALLRSMKQAEYTIEEIGHYALAEEQYCHFTSPIRRYPDLTIHRLVGAIAAHKKGKLPKPDVVALSTLAKHCSAMERRAASAERELVKVKLLTYMSTRIGEELDTIITGVQDFGFFCQGTKIPAEGMVHVTSLSDDYYYYDETSQSLIGRRSGVEYRLGSPVKVVVARVDVDRRQLDFRMVGAGIMPPAEPLPEAPRRKPTWKGKPTKDNKQFPQQKFGKQRDSQPKSKKKGKSKKKKR
ncbi:MAG: rnr [Planctomycetaceae bacterium]|nr:rnr [Planctomycetaceae bacterium]